MEKNRGVSTMNNDRFKFRVWDNHEGAYIQDLVNVCHINSDGSLQCFSYGAEELGNIGDVIEQCTGLKDCKGQLIYEGDIVRYYAYEQDKHYVGVVKWDDNTDTASGYFIDRGDCGNNDHYSHYLEGISCEVIGNIHENKELLGMRIMML